MHITYLPKEVLCHILSFLGHESYFNAIYSNIFPIEMKQYKNNEFLKLKSKQSQEKEINDRERRYRITQGKILIHSFVEEHMPHFQNIVNDNIHEWDDEIDKYFLYDTSDDTFVTRILDYASQYEY